MGFSKILEGMAVFGVILLGIPAYEKNKFFEENKSRELTYITTNSVSHEILKEVFFDREGDCVVDSYTIGNESRWAFNARLYARWMMSDEMKEYVDSKYIQLKNLRGEDFYNK